MKNEESIGQVIQHWLKDEKIKRKVIEAKIISSWPSICGPLIAKHTQKIYLDQQTLVVQIQSATMRQELTLGKELLIQHINEYLKENYIQCVKIF